MKNLLLAAALALPLAFSGCSQISDAVKTVCDDISKMPPAAALMLDAVDTHSALGVYWADAKSGCANGVPTAGVDTSWTDVVWGSVKALAPTLIPMLIGLL